MNGLSVWLAPGQEHMLAETVARAGERAALQRQRLAAAGLAGQTVDSLEQLRALPVMRKDELGGFQKQARPFGHLLGEPVGDLARIFVSAGDIYDPEGNRPDYWRYGVGLAAAGFEQGQIVLNCSSYHLSPLGFILDSAARSLGCVVIPAGVGQQELQLRVAADTGATGYIGLPSYLLALLEKAEADGVGLQLERAFVSAEPLPPSLRQRIQAYGVEVYQGYGTADLGLLAYECPALEGMHLEAGVALEICDPDGQPLPAGAVGEVVVTALDPTYPLLRFGTGDLSALMTEPCACGRAAPRMRGWLGRAGDVVKVRGLFLYPRQVSEALAPFGAGVARWQAVIGRDERHVDQFTLRVELGPDGPDAADIVTAVQALTRLRPRLERVAPGVLTPESPQLNDQREWA